MNVKQILIQWLKEHGCDGLAAPDCGCGIDNLIPCESDPSNCEPARAEHSCTCDLTDGTPHTHYLPVREDR